jgi:hypothetical protein
MSKSTTSKITGIFLEKFQTIVNPTFFQLDKLTFIYGPNSAGKSAIIDALKVLTCFSGIREESDYYSFVGFTNRYSSKGYGSFNIGIEYISGSGWCLRNTEDEKRWWNTSTGILQDLSHQDFFIELNNRKVQLQLGFAGESISLAIDGDPLFEIKDQYFRYDIFLNRINDGDDKWDDEPLDERTIGGKIVFYKKNPLLKYLPIDITSLYQSSKTNYYDKESPFFRILIEDDENTLTVNGITFNADRRNTDNEFVSSWFGLEEMLHTDHEKLKWHTEYLKNPNDYLKFLDKHYKKNTQYSSSNQRNRIKDLVYEISAMVNKLILGFRFHMADALIHSHVKGSRGVLNSELCFDYSQTSNFKLESHLESDRNYMSSYAKNLLDKKFYWRWSNKDSNSFGVGGTNTIEFDFVNDCFLKFLPSLKGYSIKAEAGRIKLPENHPGTIYKETQNTPVYLYLERDKKRYGFEDVGSGLSYIFPILTSLNAINFSVIEQPELHLHPASQCELADVFLAARHHGSIALIESHSEHILLRVLRRIRETSNGFLLRDELKVSENDIRIYYFDPQEKGVTHIKEIRVDKYGELLNTWPGGFFSEREKELFGERDIRN